MPDAAYVATGNFVETATKNSSIIPPFPGGTPVAGQVAICHVLCSAFGTNVVSPTIVETSLQGFRQLGPELYATGFVNTRSPRQRLYYKFLTGSDTVPSFQMTGGTNDGTSARIGAVISTFANVGVIRLAVGAVGDNNTITGNGITTKAANGLAAAFTGMGDANTSSAQAFTDPAAPTERYDNVVSSRLALSMSTGTRTTAGATGSFTATPSGTTDPWCVHVLAFEEVETFPSDSVVFDFNVADTQLSTGNWVADTFNFTNTAVNVVSNQAAGVDGGGVDERSYYSAVQHSADGEIAASVPTLMESGGRAMLAYRIQAPDTDGVDGYELVAQGTATIPSIKLDRIDNKSFTTLATFNQAMQAGDRFGVRFTAGSHELYVVPASGPKIHIGTVSDSTYTVAGNGGIGVRGTTVRLDDFVLGDLVAGIDTGSSSITASITGDAFLTCWVNFSAEATLSAVAVAGAGAGSITETTAGHVTADSGEIAISGSQVLVTSGHVTVDAANPSLRFIYGLSTAGLATADGAAVTHNGFPAPVGRNKDVSQLGVPGSGDLVRGSVGVPGSTE